MDEQQRRTVNVATPQRNGRDVDRTARLLAAYIARLNGDTLAALAEEI